MDKPGRANHAALPFRYLVMGSTALISHDIVWIRRVGPQIAKMPNLLHDHCSVSVSRYDHEVGSRIGAASSPNHVLNKINGHRRAASAGVRRKPTEEPLKHS